MIVDAHAHIFRRIRGLVGAGRTRGAGYGRATVGEHIVRVMPPLCQRTTHSSEMLIAHMDWAGVDRAVLLQGPFYGGCNNYVLESVRRHPERLIGAAHMDPWGRGAHRAFDAVAGSGGFRAVKLECSEPTGLLGLHPEARLDSPDIGWLWHEMERRRLVLVLDLGGIGSRSYQTDAVRSIAQAHPQLRIVIAHLGQPPPPAQSEPGPWNEWQRQVDLGKLPNVWFDTASLPAYVSSEGYPYPTAARYLRTAIERIGAARVMWGTDIPGLLVHATYPQLRSLAELHTEFLSPSDRALVLGLNAERVYA